MNPINRIGHLFSAERPDMFRDFCAHVDGFVMIEKNDEEVSETAARVEVFETPEADRRRFDDSTDELFDASLAANMIPIKCGQRFRVWNDRNSPVKLCFLPTDISHPVLSLNLFAQP